MRPISESLPRSAAHSISYQQFTSQPELHLHAKSVSEPQKGFGQGWGWAKDPSLLKVAACAVGSCIFFLPAHSSPAASPSLLFRIWPLHDIRHFRQEGGLETPGLPSSLIYPVALCQTPQEKCWLEAKLALKLALLFVVASTWSLCGISVAKITSSVRLGG